jgi:hypothetical protein
LTPVEAAGAADGRTGSSPLNDAIRSLLVDARRSGSAADGRTGCPPLNDAIRVCAHVCPPMAAADGRLC